MRQDFVRPTRVKWLFPQAAVNAADPMAWVQHIPSKSARVIARQLDQILLEAGLECRMSPLTAESYADWYAFYARKMVEQQHEVMAKPGWFELRQSLFREMLLLELLQSATGQRIGAAIITCRPDGEWNKPYRASERVILNQRKNLSVGILLDLLSLRFIFAHQPTLVKSGASRNAFGMINTLGYLAYKLKIGYEPWLFPEFEVETNFPRLNSEAPTAWFVTPAVSAGTRTPLKTLIVSPSTTAVNTELCNYIISRNIEIVSNADAQL